MKIDKDTMKEEMKKAFISGLALGNDLGGYPYRVASMVAGEKDPKQIENILRKELDAIFRRLK